MVQNWSLNDETALKFFNILKLFYYVGQTPDVSVEIEKSKMTKNIMNR